MLVMFDRTPVWNVLEGEFQLKLANSQHIRNIPGKKTDAEVPFFQAIGTKLSGRRWLRVPRLRICATTPPKRISQKPVNNC